jgi:hypothetical protein
MPQPMAAWAGAAVMKVELAMMSMSFLISSTASQ